MSVSTTQWLPVESPQAWIPQSTPAHNLFNIDFVPQDYSHANPLEEFWFKLPQSNSNTSTDDASLNWNDFVNNFNINNHTMMNGLSSLPRTTSSGFIDTSIWDLPASPYPSTPKKLDKTNSESPSYSPSSPAFSPVVSPATARLSSRNLDIEVELSRQNLYKTELCRSWLESAICKYGNKCQFAHGQHELRPVIRHPKYKTEICKTFHTNGTCPYGKRCRFVHNPAELRSHPTLTPSSSSESLESLPPSLISHPLDNNDTNPLNNNFVEDEEWRLLQERFKLANIAPDPVFYPSSESSPILPSMLSQDDEEDPVVASSPVVGAGSSHKGSGLPFFQKLRKQKQP